MIKINDGNKEPYSEDKKVPEEINEDGMTGPRAEDKVPEDETAAGIEEAEQDVPKDGAAADGAQAPEDGHAADTEAEAPADGDESEKTGDEEAPEEDPAGCDEAEKSEEDKADCDETGSDESEEAGKEPGMFFGSRKLKKEIEKKDELIKEQNEKYIRLMAEFDNYRKRTEKEKSAMYAMGVKDVVEKILPVVDNFERGFSLVDAEDAEDPFTEGMMKIYKQLMTTLTDIGVTPIEAVGKEFDPNLHNAVMHVDDESVGENIVVQEFQKGYMYKDSVVRHSMVQVAN